MILGDNGGPYFKEPVYAGPIPMLIDQHIRNKRNEGGCQNPNHCLEADINP